MERIKRIRIVFCKYLSSIAKEKNIPIEEIVKATNRSYSEVKKILEGLISPSLDELVAIAEFLGTHITLNAELPLGHKRIERALLQLQRSNPGGQST